MDFRGIFFTSAIVRTRGVETAPLIRSSARTAVVRSEVCGVAGNDCARNGNKQYGDECRDFAMDCLVTSFGHGS
jgi:hypothetical protein